MTVSVLPVAGPRPLLAGEGQRRDGAGGRFEGGGALAALGRPAPATERAFNCGQLPVNTQANRDWLERVQRVQERLRLSNTRFAAQELDCTAPEYRRFVTHERPMSQRCVLRLLERHGELVPVWTRCQQRALAEELHSRRQLRGARPVG